MYNIRYKGRPFKVDEQSICSKIMRGQSITDEEAEEIP